MCTFLFQSIDFIFSSLIKNIGKKFILHLKKPVLGFCRFWAGSHCFRGGALYLKYKVIFGFGVMILGHF